MDQKRPNNSEELHSKKEKLVLYKEMLHSLKNGSLIDDYLLAKQESHDFKFQTEGVLRKMDKYHYNSEQKTKQLFAQLQSVTETINGLKKDMTSIKEKMDRIQVHELMEKMNRFIDEQSMAKKKEEPSEVDRLNLEIHQLKQLVQTTHQPQENFSPIMEPPQQSKQRTSEYRKLQNMLKSARVSQPRNDYQPPMSHQPSYNPYQQGYQGPSQGFQGPSQGFQAPSPSFSKQSRAKAGKSKTYVNPQFDLNQQTTVRANSKKNDEKSAQNELNEKSVQNGLMEETEAPKKTIQFQLMRPESAQMAKQMRMADNTPSTTQENAADQPKTPDKKESTNDTAHAASNEETTKKKERSLFSLFQRWNS
ncbi:hypothetical protein SAMN05192559_103140 [Halobacillus karajensis]|uniref:Uncharacterized protein n=1 Tax=Halobacillus karajensis TaxID=195088 RepID=A0A024P2K8_9BACI|nr:hypothetical protein [Halobacillus karajensis]CDQ19915.1 hypothetical protein BN982_02222 [Halobacillus karajensis]CDQ22375.1 hypothetical protein BN983_00583 [Halobacillus karajensis]CDQ28218.1 hypothetical protein BN981_02512 [Halobacillus karajensis]SEH69981.1 hypothetical protein SAMN05192559_103140 [Halobacillus karajensis]